MIRNTKLRDLMGELVGEMVDKGIYWDEAVAQFEKQFIQKSLKKSGGSLLKTSASMGIHRNTLSKKITQHKIARGKE
ncbi:MAG TPA: helix-turn-helix domain-containing protein [Acidobacteriota bacterium]|nr:helix-turn-helix domain-containing protein [Acidobacteriota bacterium]